MNKKTNNTIKKIITFFMVSIILVVSIDSIGYASTNNIKTVVEHYKENGVTYTVKYTYIGNSLDICVENSENNDKNIISRVNEHITITECDYQGKTFFGKKKYEEKTLYSSELNSSEEDVTSEAYGKKTYEKWKEKYWYSKNSTSTKLLYKIGCVATYELNFDKLSSTYQSYLNSYISSITKCNSACNKAISALGTTIAEQVIDILLVLLVSVPAVAAAGMVIAMIGGGAIGVNRLIDAYDYYQDVIHYYDIVKIKGTKL